MATAGGRAGCGVQRMGERERGALRTLRMYSVQLRKPEIKMTRIGMMIDGWHSTAFATSS